MQPTGACLEAVAWTEPSTGALGRSCSRCARRCRRWSQACAAPPARPASPVARPGCQCSTSSTRLAPSMKTRRCRPRCWSPLTGTPCLWPTRPSSRRLRSRPSAVACIIIPTMRPPRSQSPAVATTAAPWRRFTLCCLSSRRGMRGRRRRRSWGWRRCEAAWCACPGAGGAVQPREEACTMWPVPSGLSSPHISAARVAPSSQVPVACE
mmetsp:Transcript_2221/g.5673  ORF Transcript_2221/g.5673 Transcript_2221/m.5673 type:complete len:209 (-) Transcript_2221:93-719(-)